MTKIAITWVLTLAIMKVTMNAQEKPTDVPSASSNDWSALFPVIPGCDRTIRPIERLDNVTYQHASYVSDVNIGRNGDICVTVLIQQISDSKWSFSSYFKGHIDTPWYRKTKVRGYTAFRGSPRCGVDSIAGSLTVFFDNDKKFTVYAYEDTAFLKIADRIDYKKIRDAMNAATK